MGNLLLKNFRWLAVFSVLTNFILPVQAGGLIEAARTVEGRCLPGVLDQNGHWDCRPSDTSPTCVDGGHGKISEEIALLVRDKKALVDLSDLIKNRVAEHGLAESISWAACQGFGVKGHPDYSKNPAAPDGRVLKTVQLHVWLRNNPDNNLAVLLLDWQATLDSPNCYLWVICDPPGELSVEVQFDEVGRVKLAKSYFTTEGL